MDEHMVSRLVAPFGSDNSTTSSRINRASDVSKLTAQLIDENRIAIGYANQHGATLTPWLHMRLTLHSQGGIPKGTTLRLAVDLRNGMRQPIAIHPSNVSTLAFDQWLMNPLSDQQVLPITISMSTIQSRVEQWVCLTVNNDWQEWCIQAHQHWESEASLTGAPVLPKDPHQQWMIIHEKEQEWWERQWTHASDPDAVTVAWQFAPRLVVTTDWIQLLLHDQKKTPDRIGSAPDG